MNRLVKTLVIAAILVGCVGKPATAAPIAIVSNTAGATEGFATFTGTLAYNPATATLLVTLQNTSPLVGYLTALAFLNPGNLITGVTLTSSNTNFTLLGGPGYNNNIAAAPFGQFDIGASTSGSWLGSGSPQKGIKSGEFATFSFVFTGTGLGGLSEEDFVDEGGSGEFMAVRFRGFPEPPTAGSDKVPASVITVTEVPEPGTLLLLASGLAVAIRRRRNSRA